MCFWSDGFLFPFLFICAIRVLHGAYLLSLAVCVSVLFIIVFTLLFDIGEESGGTVKLSTQWVFSSSSVLCRSNNTQHAVQGAEE